MTAPGEDASAKPEEVAEGEEPPAVKAQANGSAPSKEATLPADAPAEVGEGANPDAVHQEVGTLDETDTVQVSLTSCSYEVAHCCPPFLVASRTPADGGVRLSV